MRAWLCDAAEPTVEMPSKQARTLGALPAPLKRAHGCSCGAAEKYELDLSSRKPVIKAAAIRYCIEHAPAEAEGEEAGAAEEAEDEAAGEKVRGTRS